MYFFTKLFVMFWHRGQVRRYTGEPYWYHCKAVSDSVRINGGTPVQIKAALLHDVLEDTRCPDWLVYYIFGEEVYDLVFHLTDVTVLSDGNRKTRKLIELKRLARIPKEAKFIKLLDLIDNVESIKQHDERFYKIYGPEALDILGVLKGTNDKLESKLRSILSS